MSSLVQFGHIITALAVLLGQGAHAADNSNPLSPIGIAPSQYWDGNDGPWSSFGLTVGTPPQNVRVLPSSSGSSLWVVLPEGCTKNDPENCPSQRGATFHINQSSTWEDQGLFKLPLYEESLLGYSGNADFGFDTVTLGWQGSGALSLNHQVVAGFATKDFYIGNLGLTPRPVNFTDFNNPEKSILGTLRNESKAASSTWAYTAGASYREPKMFGSLTFGGYDSTRFVPNGLSFPFGADISRDLIVTLRSVTSGTNSLLSNSIVTFIDSTVPHIWLPVEACRKFESLFGLVWDNATDLYLVNDALHESLVAKNASITFTLGKAASGGETVDIVLPYGAFDLTVTLASKNLSSRYFPIRRAHNDTQFTLGRTFLQEAYVIVDYDRSNFSVSRALFPDTSVAQNLVSIHPGNGSASPSSSPSSPSSPSSDKGRHGLRMGVIAVIVAIAAAVIAISLVGLFFWRRRAQRAQQAQQAQRPSGEPSEPDPAFEKAELDAVAPAVKLQEFPDVPVYEAPDSSLKHELPSEIEIYELPADEVRSELESPMLKTEVLGSDPPPVHKI